MFEIVRAIHEALGIESTLAFVLVIAIVGGLASGCTAWIVDKGYKNSIKDHLYPAHSKNEPQPTEQTDEKPPTLADLFKNDFATTMKSTGSTWELRDNTQALIASGSVQTYLDFPARAKYIGFLIPRSQHSYEAAKLLWERVAPQFDEMPKQVSIQMRGFGNTTDLKDLTFSGRVFLYHEDFFTARQVADLIDVYRAHNMAVEFRGPDYLGTQVVAWHQRRDKK